MATPAQEATPDLYNTLASASLVPAAAALTPAEAGADPYFVEPRVPRAAGTPCVETVARDVSIAEGLSSIGFGWTPTGACTGPFAKIVLVVEISGPREPAPAAMVLHFSNFENQAPPDPGGGALFMGAPQHHDLVGTWRYERDLTEYADMLDRGFQFGYASAPKDNDYHDAGEDLATKVRAIKLVYYPASSSTPAQRTADVMRALDTFMLLGTTSWTFEDLPRNIERAYLDVMARTHDPARAWYSCVPTALAETWPQLDSRFGMGDFRPLSFGSFRGCEAAQGSYREVEVFIDDQLAGLAPVFPSLPSTMFDLNIVDYPAPSVQALNIMPFRVDLTPFAAVLNDGLPHTVMARVTNSAAGDGGALVTGQLLLYLDKGRSVVTGALTRNTLASQPGVAGITHTLALTGDTLQGDIRTYLRREYNIEGYVDTSKGRVRSTVYQVSRFANTQSLRVVGPDTSAIPDREPYEQDYLQKIRLSSTVDRVTRRIRGTLLLAEDKDYTTYPLILDFSNGGFVDWSDEGLPFAFSEHLELDVSHARGQRASHFRPGNSRYETSLSDTFKGSHSWLDPDTLPGTHFDWWSKRRYLFTDNRSSCYSAGITTANGELQTRTRGTECPNGINGLRWYSHPDGAPEGMLWAVNP